MFFNSTVYLLFIIFVFIIAFFLRIYLLLKHKWIGKDTFYHLMISREIRKNKKLPEKINNFIYPEEYDYPPLLHVILSFFDEKFHQKLQYLSPIFDMIAGLVIFIFCLNVFSLEIATISTTLYLFTPFIYDISFSLSPRSIGNTFMIISLFSLFLYFTYGSIFTIIISIVFSTLVLLTHRLTTQSLIFVLLSICIGFHSSIPLLIILCSVLLALLFTKGFYLSILMGHIDFIKSFGRKILNKNNRKEMPNLFPNPISTIFNMPIFLIIPVFFLYYNELAINFFVVWGLGLTILSIIWIFGEGTRHLANAVPAFSIIGTIWSVESQKYIILLLLIMTSLIFLIYKIHRLEKKSNLGTITNKSILKGFDYIKSNRKNGDVLLCLPLDFTYAAAYFTDCIMLLSGGGFAKGLGFNQKLHKRLKERKTNELIRKYNASWIIVVGENKYNIIGRNVFNEVNIEVIKIDGN